MAGTYSAADLAIVQIVANIALVALMGRALLGRAFMGRALMGWALLGWALLGWALVGPALVGRFLTVWGLSSGPCWVLCEPCCATIAF